MKFELGPGVECDLDSLIDSRLLIQANSGGGKSWLIRRILEETFGHVQHLVIDPEGEFASLRDRFDYVLAARNGGDTAADPRSAKLLARKLLELNASAILDIYELKAHERVRFVRAFLEELVDAPKKLWHPVLIVIDEAHVYCPQKGDAESANAVIDLATRGRKRGFCSIIATQRLSKLHKDAAAECNNKLIGRSALDVDMRRASEELGFAGRDEQHQLRELEPGEFFAFGPAMSKTVTRVTIGDVQTHHPKAGGRQAFEPPPPTEKVKALLPQLSDLPAEAEAERLNIKELKQTVATVRGELTRAKKAAPPPSEELIERKVTAATDRMEREHAQIIAGYMRIIKKAGEHVGKAAKELMVDVPATNGTGQHGDGSALLRTSHDAGRSREEVSARQDDPPTARRSELPPRASAAPPSTNGTEPLEGIRKGARRILAELARRYPLAWTKSQVAQLVGMTASGGTFGAYIGDLRRAGLIAINGKEITVTDGGLDAAGEVPAAPATHDEVMVMWRDKMRAGEFRLLERIAEAGEDGIEKSDLALEVEMTMTGGTFGAYIGTLARNNLIEKRGSLLVPSPMLWPELVA